MIDEQTSCCTDHNHAEKACDGSCKACNEADSTHSTGLTKQGASRLSELIEQLGNM